MNVPNQPLAERYLKWSDGHGERDVVVRVWKPVLYDGHYVCDFAVDGLPTPGRGQAAGVDSLQALILALSRIRKSLAPYRDEISWLGMAGIHGVPMSIQSLTDDPQDERRLERLVEAQASRALEELAAPKKERTAKFRARHDPSFNDDLALYSTAEVVEHLRAAAVTEREHRQAGNRALARVFGLKRLELIGALRERSDYLQTLQALTADADPAIRLQAAQMLEESPLAIEALERLRDDGVEPEAGKARETLSVYRRANARPKPWDQTS